MQQSQRKSRQRLEDEADLYGRPNSKSSRLVDSWPMLAMGAMFLVAFGLAGHIIGSNSSASIAPQEIAEPQAIVAPESLLATKGSLLPEGDSFAGINSDIIIRQSVASDGKSDLALTQDNLVAPVDGTLHTPKHVAIANQKTKQRAIKIIPASVDLKDEESLALAPKPLKKSPVALVKADAPMPEKKLSPIRRRLQLAEENCLARAVYFESRSESDLGQLAVAKVILNRVKHPNFPKTICGVVYQGSGSRNSCQFSFACDGLPDDVRQPGSWAHAKIIAQRAINNDPAVRKLGAAVNYHADYVSPRWSKTMRRIARIGHHIFYAGDSNG